MDTSLIVLVLSLELFGIMTGTITNVLLSLTSARDEAITLKSVIIAMVERFIYAIFSTIVVNLSVLGYLEYKHLDLDDNFFIVYAVVGVVSVISLSSREVVTIFRSLVPDLFRGIKRGIAGFIKGWIQLYLGKLSQTDDPKVPTNEKDNDQQK